MPRPKARSKKKRPKKLRKVAEDAKQAELGAKAAEAAARHEASRTATIRAVSASISGGFVLRMILSRLIAAIL